MSLHKNVGKGPYTFRRVDKIVITDNQAVHPDTFCRVASSRPTTVWQQPDPWGGFSRISRNFSKSPFAAKSFDVGHEFFWLMGCVGNDQDNA